MKAFTVWTDPLTLRYETNQLGMTSVYDWHYSFDSIVTCSMQWDWLYAYHHTYGLCYLDPNRLPDNSVMDLSIYGWRMHPSKLRAAVFGRYQN